MPTSCSRLSLPNPVKRGALSWHGTHHDAQTLTTLTLPLKTAGSSPGTGAPLLTRPSSGGSAVCGAGRPIRAEGIFDGSSPPSRSQKITTNAVKASNGSAVSHDRRGAVLLEVVGSLMRCPPHRVRNAWSRLMLRDRAGVASGDDSRSPY